MTRIAVCVRRIIDRDEQLAPVAGGVRSAQGEPAYTLNPADVTALEVALRVRDAHPETTVIAVTLGPAETEPFLREALALGVDRALRVWDDACADGDTFSTARTLAAAIRPLAPDLILCGDRASDGNTGQVGLQIAALLGVPGISGADHLEMEAGAVRAERRLDRSRRSRVSCALPAVCIVEAGSNRPRYPRMSDRLRSTREPIDTTTLHDLGLSPADVGLPGSKVALLSISKPKPTRQGIFVPDESLSPEQRWEQLISGGLPSAPPPRQLEEPTTAERIEEVIAFLVEGKYC